MTTANTVRGTAAERIAAEDRRVAAIQVAIPDHPLIAADAIEHGWTVGQARLAALKAAGGGRHGGRTIASTSASTGTADPEVVEASMLLSLGLKPAAVADQLPASVRERVMNQANAKENRGYSLHALMDATVHAAGQSFHGTRKSDSFARKAIEADQTLRAQGGTTISLSGILANVANKVMLARYTAQNTTWDKIAAVRSHSDFKVVTRYRLDSTGAFRKIGPDGELKHVGLQDAAYSNKLDTFGAIITLNRQMMINNDLNAFAELPGALGDMAAIRLEEAVYVLFLSNAGSFFSVGNRNLLTGAGSVFGEAAVTAAETAFRNQVTASGKPILGGPAVLLVPTTLEVAANKLNTGTTVIAIGQGSTPATVTDGNPHAGKYPPVVSPYLNNTAIRDQDGKAITGQSDTAWYMFADPAQRAAVGVALLNGQRLPTIESSETEFQTLGMSWRGYLDFGVGFEDPTAAEKNAGA